MSTTALETQAKPCTPHTWAPRVNTMQVIYIATTVIKLQHSWWNYTNLRFSQRYENSSSNATPCSPVDKSRRSEWPSRLRQNPLKHRYASTALYGLTSRQTAIFEFAANIQPGYACCYSIWNHSSSTKKLSKYTNPLFYPFYLDVAHCFSH